MYRVHWRTAYDMMSARTFDKAEFQEISEAERAAKLRTENTLLVYQVLDSQGFIVSEWKAGQRLLGNDGQKAACVTTPVRTK